MTQSTTNNPSSCGIITTQNNCSITWLINATGSPGSSYNLTVNATSNIVKGKESKAIKIDIV